MTEEHHTVELFLSQPQFLKYKRGKTFQLNNAQLQAEGGKHKVDVALGKKDYNKLLKAINSGKGFRFSDKIVKGGSLWGSFKEGVKKVGRFIKNNVNKDTVKAVLKKGVDYIPENYVNEKYKGVAKSGIDKLVDYGYNNNEDKSLKENAISIAKELSPELDTVKRDVKKRAIQKAEAVVKDLSKKYIGDGIRAESPMNKRPIKGSPEAKERMARLRSMRKMKGCGMLGDLVLPVAGMVTGQMLGGIPGAYVGNALGSVAGKMIDGNGLENTTHLKHGQLINGVPRPVVSKQSAASIKKKGYHPKQRGKNGLHINGGSMLELGGSMVQLGGSFKSPGQR